jgi:hypothetical protein
MPTDDGNDDAEKKIHDHAYGIASNPLTQFACIFAALIHTTSTTSAFPTRN